MNTEDPKTKGPVFIVGMNGSGTTMIHHHLGQHRELYAFPQESYVLPHFMNIEGKFGDLADVKLGTVRWRKEA